MLKINYGINRRVGRRIVHLNGRLCVKGDLNSDATHAIILNRIRVRNPGWNVTGWALRPEKKPTHVFMVMPWCVPLIDDRIKRTTVRATRKRMPKAGEYIELRRWLGKPYRSRQDRVLCCRIDSVRSFAISARGEFFLAGKHLDADHRELVARKDGFPGPAEMVAFFSTTHGLPFTGFITEWL